MDAEYDFRNLFGGDEDTVALPAGARLFAKGDDAHTMYIVKSGAVDFLSVLTSFGSVLEYELHYVDELASFHVATSQLEEMTGAPLVH